MSFRVHIEHLVLDGFSLSSTDGRDLKAALVRELSSMIAAESAPDRWLASVALPSAPAGEFDPAPDATPAQLGTQIARSVHRAIGGPK